MILLCILLDMLMGMLLLSRIRIRNKPTDISLIGWKQ